LQSCSCCSSWSSSSISRGRVSWIIGISRSGRRCPPIIAAFDIPRPCPQTDHVLSHQLALLVPLLGEFSVGFHLAVGSGTVLQVAEAECHEEFDLVVAAVAGVGRVDDHLVDPNWRWFQFHDLVVEQGGLDVFRVGLLAEAGALQGFVQLAVQQEQVLETCPLVFYQEL